MEKSCSARMKINSRLIFLGTLLNDCIEDCNIGHLRRLLEEDRADPNVLLPELNYTPFHTVAGIENEDFAEEAAQLILKHGGNPNVRADESLTPVHVAASWGHARVLRVLLDGGGSPWSQDELGKTALDYARENDEQEALVILSDFSQDEESKETDPMSMLLRRLQEHKIPSKEKNTKEQKMYRESKVTTNLPTCFEEKEETANNISIIDLTCTDSEDSNSSFQDKGDEDIEIAKVGPSAGCSVERLLFSSLPAMSSSVESSLGLRSLSSVSCSLSERSHASCSSADETSSSSLSDRATSKTSLPSENCKKRLPLSSTSSSVSFEYDPSESANTPVMFSSINNHLSSISGAKNISAQKQVQRTSLIRPMSRRSLARDLIMAPQVPEILVTRPSLHSVEIEFSKEALEEHNNSPNFLRPGKSSFTKQHIHQWINSVSNSSPIASTSSATYHTCESNPTVQEKLNTAALENKLELTDNSVKTCATVSEQYRYADKEEDIILYEERWLANPLLLSDCPQTDHSSLSAGMLHTETETVDTDDLRNELKSHGIDYGPITVTTKKVYKQQLHKKKKYNVSFGRQETTYSHEIQRTFREKKSLYFVSSGAQLERKVAVQFTRTDSRTNWREGNLKMSFTYLLLDPRITKNLPCRAPTLPPKQVWKIFLRSIFYVGKGKRSRPYSHLYEAVQNWNKDNFRYVNSKVKRISEIWQEGLGVVCLHVFQNVIPVEAYTREAAMIDAIGLQNLCNMKRSEYYGKAAQWYSQDQRILGVYLLYKSLQIFLAEGERHLSPFDIM